jgi:Fur family ferric uptake transcriptional regulator
MISAAPAGTRLLKDEDLRALLAGASLRVTHHRMALLRELARLRVPASHAELTERLASGSLSSSLDRVTIYRNLLALTEAGLLVRTQLGDNTWRFELPRAGGEQHGQHPHFVCTDCGDVACLPAGSVVLRGEAARSEVLEVQLRGRCAACARS